MVNFLLLRYGHASLIDSLALFLRCIGPIEAEQNDRHINLAQRCQRWARQTLVWTCEGAVEAGRVRLGRIRIGQQGWGKKVRLACPFRRQRLAAGGRERTLNLRRSGSKPSQAILGDNNVPSSHIIACTLRSSDDPDVERGTVAHCILVDLHRAHLGRHVKAFWTE